MTEKELLQQKENHILKLEKEVSRLKKDIKNQDYGLVFKDVPEAFEDDTENKLPILEEVNKKSIKNKNTSPTHILIEGDNYHALTCLNYTHKNKIDVIYIDPPYNTGEDGFRYKDKRVLDKYPDGTDVPKDHPFRHSYWLSFMRKRLELSKDLLTKEGVIFISIDDNEFAQLKLLADSIFGETSLLGILNWQNKTKPVNSGKAKYQIQQNIEYILCYSNGIAKEKYSGFILKEQGQRKYNFETKNGLARLVDIEDSDSGRKKRDTMKFPILGVIPQQGKRWKIGLQEVNRLIEEERIILVDGKVKKVIYPEDENQAIEKPFWSLLLKEQVDTAEDGKKELSIILGKEHGFDTVKPTKLIRELLNHFDNDITVLDFFAGSGTTGHAVMQLNKNEETKGLRQFILVTDNENNIMSDICLPRIKKAVEGYEENDALAQAVKFYKTAFVGRHNILDADDKDKIQLAHHAGEMLAIAENTLEQVKNNDYWQIFESNSRMTAVYFREEQDQLDDFVKEVLKLKKPVTVYMFSWEEKMDITDFEDNKNINLKTIPQPILEIYKQIYNII